MSEFWTRYDEAMSMTVTWTLGELIAKARRDAGMDQPTLAERAKIARSSLSNYETGRSVPPFDVMVRIAAVCGVSLEWLASAVVSQTEGWEFESLRAHTELRQCDSLRRESVGGFVVPPFWTPERSLVLAAMWRQVEPDAEIAIPEGSAR